jgi:predicted nucleic acid-binding protein
VIHLDTSALVDALTGPKRSAARLRDFIAQGERIGMSTLVLYEWRRGPRTREELRAQEALFPSAEALPFAAREAGLAADAYRTMRRPRGREIDLAIAACAIAHGAALWTLNRADFADMAGLSLVE